ncbi:SDR family NAD(P)-dependent oxidoreductase [Spirillospora sp. CA-142024]|uniref:SDR family NAD(P)-dependent oxidoreductase n=1 Tax=Spirillospora sp. CA-142024 TaxID=3240036 RepID=UPI003D8F7DBF
MIADHTGSVALVTGAASGIGRAVARLLAEQGALVEATDIDPQGLAELAAEHETRIRTTVLDVTDADAVHAAARHAADRHGRIDVLVASAGIVVAEEREAAADTPRDWDRCFAVNVRGTDHACEAVPDQMRAQGGGSIVTLGSISAHAARTTLGAYPASKAAALRYTKGLAPQVAPAGIRVNSVCPGAVWTGIQARIIAEAHRVVSAHDPTYITPAPGDGDARAFFEPYRAITPLGRPQSTRDVAAAVAFLASSDAVQITGQCLHVDGGAVIRD